MQRGQDGVGKSNRSEIKTSVRPSGQESSPETDATRNPMPPPPSASSVADRASLSQAGSAASRWQPKARASGGSAGRMYTARLQPESVKNSTPQAAHDAKNRSG